MNNQRGQIGIFVIFACLLALGLFLLQGGKFSPSQKEESECVSPPDPTQAITFQGKRYFLIRSISALSFEQFKWHMIPHDPSSTDPNYTISVDGKTKRVFRPATNCETRDVVCRDNLSSPECKNYTDSCRDFPNNPGGTNFGDTSHALDLLFVDVTDSVSLLKQAPGYRYTEIYLKEKDDHSLPDIPDFIQNFCKTNQPVDPLRIFPNEKGQNPPFSIKSADIRLDSGKSSLSQPLYTLFSYERFDSDAGRIHSNIASKIGALNVNSKTFTAYFVTYAGFVSLVDQSDPVYVYLYTSKNLLPTPTAAADAKNTIQLKSLESAMVYPWGWWSPECKPAIYLYPKEKTKVHVEVKPEGYLTYTNPVYPPLGWDVEANPNGIIKTFGKDYNYLYYESKIRDSAINKPKKGYVVKFDGLPKFYDSILPKLGLTIKEALDFKDYWQKVLPYSPYYFVGLMDEKDIEKIEPLTISPKPNIIIRIRFYFEALDKKILVQEPVIERKVRNGFTVVEWGGLVKVDKNHPFTCSE